MYVILDDADVVIGFETRDGEKGNFVNSLFADHYILTIGERPKLGDVYDRQSGTFTITPVPEPEPEPILEAQKEPPLSATEQAIMQTAITTEYMAALMETTI